MNESEQIRRIKMMVSLKIAKHAINEAYFESNEMLIKTNVEKIYHLVEDAIRDLEDLRRKEGN